MSEIDNEPVEGVNLNEIEFTPILFPFGPYLPIGDYRVVAGLLCDRHSSGKSSVKRTLLMRSLYTYDHVPYVLIAAERDFHEPEYRAIPVTQEAANELIERRYVSGTPHMGYTDDRKLRLNKTGARKVVEVWFRGHYNVIDAVYAGATWDLSRGELRW